MPHAHAATFRTRLLLAAAAAMAVPLGLASVASAQFRVGNDGHANDASNRVGSGGYNGDPAAAGGPGVTGNQIVTGNVTGGFQFRGRVPYTDPYAFRGRLPGLGLDQFIRDSAGVPSPGQLPPAFAAGPRPYYQQATTVAPPPGFVQKPYTGGYVPATIAPPISADLRLGVPLGPPDVGLPKPGELVLPGPVDPTANNTDSITTASPLYGVRQWQLNDQGDQFLVNNYANAANPSPLERMGISPDQVLNMRRELNQTIQPAGASETGNGAGAGAAAAPGGATPLGQPVASALQPLQPLGGAANRPLDPLNVTPQAGDVSTAQRTRQVMGNVPLPAPQQQSALYAELRRRLEQLQQSQPKTDEEANRQFQAALAARRALTAKKPGAPNGPSGVANATPGGQASPQNLPATPQQPAGPGNTEKPVQVPTLTQGVQAPGLKDLLGQAEALMKQQKFAEAIDKYDAAQQVVPNNPLIQVGRANAELGGSFYARAASDLRDAFRGDRALLLAQYDLKGLVGQDRLQYVVTELKQIASDSPDNPTPVFLLAYIAYNTGNEAKAAGYLQTAQQRAGGNDDVITDLQKYWTLNPAAPKDSKDKSQGPDFNK